MTIFIKTMPRERYQSGLVHNTNSYNYSKSAGIENRADRILFDLVIDISRSTDTGFGLLVSFAINAHKNSLSLQAVDAIEKGEALDLLLAEESTPSGRWVGADQLQTLIDFASRADLKASTHTIACRFWEHLYEKIRSEDFPDRPKRLKSFFAFKDEGTATWYRNTHKQGEVMCRVKVTQCRVAFEADMTILDGIDEAKNYEQARPEICRYWRQEMNEAPRVEVLIQGQFKVLDRIG